MVSYSVRPPSQAGYVVSNRYPDTEKRRTYMRNYMRKYRHASQQSHAQVEDREVAQLLEKGADRQKPKAGGCDNAR